MTGVTGSNWASVVPRSRPPPGTAKWVARAPYGQARRRDSWPGYSGASRNARSRSRGGDGSRSQGLDRFCDEIDGVAERSGVEGEACTGDREKLRQRTSSTQRKCRAIATHGSRLILERVRPALNGAELRQTELHDVEGHDVDVKDPMPAGGKCILESAPLDPRNVSLAQLGPLSVQLVRISRVARIGVDPGLERLY